MKNEKSPPNIVEYQFGGPRGVACMMVFFITLTYFIAEKCQSGHWDVFQIPDFPVSLSGYFDTRSAVVVTIWFMLQCGLYALPFGGPVLEGTMIKSCNKRLRYRGNALFVLAVNLSVLILLFLLDGRVTALPSMLLRLTTSCFTIFLCVSIILHIRSYYVDSWKLNPNGQTGNIFYDWFIGRELNPRIGHVDLKYVMFRSGIIGWIMFNTVIVMEAFEAGQSIRTLCAVWMMQFIYVIDYFWFEEGVIVSRDIVHEGLGANISIQFIMIPFTFIAQTRYLQTTGFDLSGPPLCGVILLYDYLDVGSLGFIIEMLCIVVGYVVYRGSNSQKNNFRKNPSDPALAHLKTMSTTRGTKLLLSGWWGLSRHPNYLGDMLIALSYSLATGVNHFLPYQSFVFLVMLLIDREQRDGAECQKKYGEDWKKYCEQVKYRIIPYIY